MTEVLFHNINPLNVPGQYVELNTTAFLLLTRQFAKRFLTKYGHLHSSLRKMAIIIMDWVDNYSLNVLAKGGIE